MQLTFLVQFNNYTIGDYYKLKSVCCYVHINKINYI